MDFCFRQFYSIFDEIAREKIATKAPKKSSNLDVLLLG